MTLAYRLLDVYSMAGSATTTTTVAVSDDTGSYTVHTGQPVERPLRRAVVRRLRRRDGAGRPRGEPRRDAAPHIDSVSVAATLDATERSARIESVELPRGLKVGANDVVISYYAYGSSTLKTLTATLTIPAGTPLSGMLTVLPGSWSGGDGSESFAMQPAGARSSAPQTLADLVADLNEMPHNSDLVLSYSAGDDGETPGDAISVTVPTDYVFSDVYQAPITFVQLRASSRTVDYGAPVVVSGFVASADDVPVAIYRQDADKADPVLSRP